MSSNPNYYPQHQPPKPKHRKWPWVLAVGAAVVIGIAVGTSGNNSTSTHTAAATSVPAGAPASAPTTPAGPATSITSDGTFLVGTDLAPGTYRAAGGDLCYWERDKDTSGNFDAIIANGGIEGGQQVVTIDPSDGAFKVRGCGTWTKVG